MNKFRFGGFVAALIATTAVLAAGDMQGMDHEHMEGMEHMQGMDHEHMQGMDHEHMQGMEHKPELPPMMQTIAVTKPAPLADDEALMDDIQKQCVQLGGVSFGAGKRWSDCEVTRGRWVGTIDLTDMYQAQYCLRNGTQECAQHALVLFGNRAYTPNAKLLVQRVDTGSTSYDDPRIVINDYGRILIISTHTPEGVSSHNYYLWKTGQWVSIDNKKWLQDLSARLPAGVIARDGALPDIDTMATQVKLFRDDDAECCPKAGVANVELGIDKEKFSLQSAEIVFNN